MSKVMLEVPIEGVQDEAEGNFCHDAAGGTIAPEWHLLKHTLTNEGPNPLGTSLQNELTRQLKLDKEKHHRSFSWKLLQTIKSVFHATQYQGDTALITIPPF